MTDTWISDGADYALLADPAEAEAWRGLGWAPADPPTYEDFLFMWREGIAEPGRVPVYALLNLWGPRGWVAGPPPGGPHPFAAKPEVAVDTKPVEAKKKSQSGDLPTETGR